MLACVSLIFTYLQPPALISFTIFHFLSFHCVFCFNLPLLYTFHFPFLPCLYFHIYPVLLLSIQPCPSLHYPSLPPPFKAFHTSLHSILPSTILPVSSLNLPSSAHHRQLPLTYPLTFVQGCFTLPCPASYAPFPPIPAPFRPPITDHGFRYPRSVPPHCPNTTHSLNSPLQSYHIRPTPQLAHLTPFPTHFHPIIISFSSQDALFPLFLPVPKCTFPSDINKGCPSSLNPTCSSAYLPSCVSTYLSIYLSICTLKYLPAYFLIYLTIYLLPYLPTQPSIYPPT